MQPTNISGPRRPQRLRKLSLKLPMIGSVIASAKRGIDNANPAKPAGMPKAVT